MSSAESNRELCSGAELESLCRKAVDTLGAALDLPPNRLEKEVDLAEREVVKVRDCLIEHLRAEEGRPSRWRKPLDEVNVALTLIAGVEYPATGIHRSYMEEAQRVLKALQETMES